MMTNIGSFSKPTILYIDKPQQYVCVCVFISLPVYVGWAALVTWLVEVPLKTAQCHEIYCIVMGVLAASIGTVYVLVLCDSLSVCTHAPSLQTLMESVGVCWLWCVVCTRLYTSAGRWPVWYNFSFLEGQGHLVVFVC